MASEDTPLAEQAVSYLISSFQQEAAIELNKYQASSPYRCPSVTAALWICQRAAALFAIVLAGALQ
jgi:hypothetical protein